VRLSYLIDTKDVITSKWEDLGKDGLMTYRESEDSGNKELV
jgi:hypothetical protein